MDGGIRDGAVLCCVVLRCAVCRAVLRCALLALYTIILQNFAPRANVYIEFIEFLEEFVPPAMWIVMFLTNSRRAMRIPIFVEKFLPQAMRILIFLEDFAPDHTNNTTIPKEMPTNPCESL